MEFFFFRSFVTKDNLRNLYPNARNLIDNLPASSFSNCFKPEAHLLIEKFLSLKKENSRDLYISNMMDHTRVRHLVSSIFKFRRTLKHFPTNAQSFLYFSPLIVGFEPSGLVGDIQRHVEIVKIYNMLYWTDEFTPVS
jgi:hypothetical protein